MVVFGELGTGQKNLVSMYYGDRWRIHRKLTHQGVGLQQVSFDIHFSQEGKGKLTLC